MGDAAGNATAAARLAGYSVSIARKQGSRLLGRPRVQAAIEERATSDPAVWSRHERQQFWTLVASGTGCFVKAPLKERLKASELLARSCGDFVEKRLLQVEGNGSLTLEQLLGKSREP